MSLARVDLPLDNAAPGLQQGLDGKGVGDRNDPVGIAMQDQRRRESASSPELSRGRLGDRDELDDDRLIIRWQERDGPPVSQPTRNGFGSKVITRGLAHELEGTVDLDYRADGVVCTIDIPAPRALS